MGYYKQGCQTALSIAGVSQPPTYGVGSREGITLRRLGPSSYAYKGWRIDKSDLRPGKWILDHTGTYEAQFLPSLRDARREIARIEVGSKEGVTLDRIEPGVYEFGKWRIRKAGPGDWHAWHPIHTPVTAFPHRTLRDVRNTILYFRKKPKVGSREGITLKRAGEGFYSYPGPYAITKNLRRGWDLYNPEHKDPNIPALTFNTLRDARRYIKAKITMSGSKSKRYSFLGKIKDKGESEINIDADSLQEAIELSKTLAAGQKAKRWSLFDGEEPVAEFARGKITIW